jgi:protein-L-isoaspartate O-methyltransferase
MAEPNFEQLKEQMITKNLMPRGITDKRVLRSFREVPRE